MARQSIFKFNERVTTEAKDATYEFRGPVISVRNLEKKFGEHEVLKDISFDLFEGDVVCIIGSSGSGKSTLLRCINHLETPTSGQILYHGYPLTKDAQTINRFRSQVGMVFQQFNLFNNMTVFDNCMAGVHKVKKRSKEYSTEICMKYLEKVGMAPYVKAKPHQLSGGMKQRVMIAIALVGSPSIVIADEPTTSLDVTIEAQILDVLKNLQKTLGTSIILITHDLGVIAKLCDRVLVMYGGKIVERGSVDEIFYDTAHPYTKGLMHSIAKLDTAKGHKLQPIEGTPPDLFAPPKGCPFAARCEYCMEICKDMPPQTYELSKEHETCCWLQHEYAPDTDMRRKVTEKGEV